VGYDLSLRGVGDPTAPGLKRGFEHEGVCIDQFVVAGKGLASLGRRGGDLVELSKLGLIRSFAEAAGNAPWPWSPAALRGPYQPAGCGSRHVRPARGQQDHRRLPAAAAGGSAQIGCASRC